MDIESVIEIAAPAETVWTIMTDVEHWPEWTAGVTSVDKLDAGALAVGSRARVRQPRLPTAVWTVTVFDRPRYFEWRNASPGLKSIGGHRIDDAGGGRVRVTLSVTWSGWLTPVVRFFYGTMSRRYVQMEAEGLKRRSEAAATRAAT